MHVVVHGGAGSAPEAPVARQKALTEAAADASVATDPLDAVCDAVRPLERDPRFNAGVGGAVQSDGAVRTDAGVMTAAGVAGAACAMSGVVQAADVARVVARETPHLLLAGTPAVELARASGIDADETLLTEQTRERWAAADPPGNDRRDHLAWVRDHFEGTDTVGAVATDGESLAVATSTAGRWFALAGRVGDVPQLGAGFYADGRGGASVTGEGEAIARFGLARRVVERLGTLGPRQAAKETLAAFESTTGGKAGVVAVDTSGHVGTEYNTEAMQTARARD
jgi:L-asparaginase/beta-aspartyl-peptidase (threonine type)